MKTFVPDNMVFLDSKELTYSFFLVSMGKIVYINTGDFNFSSGLLMVPDDMSALSSFQQASFDKILSKMPKEDSFVISKVSSLERVMNGEFYYTEDDVLTYLDSKHI